MKCISYFFNEDTVFILLLTVNLWRFMVVDMILWSIFKAERMRPKLKTITGMVNETAVTLNSIFFPEMRGNPLWRPQSKTLHQFANHAFVHLVCRNTYAHKRKNVNALRDDAEEVLGMNSALLVRDWSDAVKTKSCPYLCLRGCCEFYFRIRQLFVSETQRWRKTHNSHVYVPFLFYAFISHLLWHLKRPMPVKSPWIELTHAAVKRADLQNHTKIV